MSKPPDDLTDLLGHNFRDPELLEEALTHPSALARGRNDRAPDYERLEFLGDRVLGLIMATRLYQDHPKAGTGALASRFNQMVQRETLAQIARDTGLAAHIRMSEGERETGGAEKPAILADVTEAVIGALYLDGGLDAAQRFVARHWQGLLDGQVKVPRDPKTALQEWAHAHGMEPPVYEVVEQTGPDHAPIFVVRATLDAGAAEGEGSSKKDAERRAAAALLAEVGGND